MDSWGSVVAATGGMGRPNQPGQITVIDVVGARRPARPCEIGRAMDPQRTGDSCRQFPWTPLKPNYPSLLLIFSMLRSSAISGVLLPFTEDRFG